MSNSKFCIFAVMIFTLFFVSGCGGSSSTIVPPSNENGDVPAPVSPDTPAPETDTDLLTAENAANDISIGYATGDSPEYVTQNLTLPTA